MKLVILSARRVSAMPMNDSNSDPLKGLISASIQWEHSRVVGKDGGLIPRSGMMSGGLAMQRGNLQRPIEIHIHWAVRWSAGCIGSTIMSSERW